MFWAQASIHAAKELTLSDVKSPPAWSMPHSMRKLLPPEVTVVPFDAGQDTLVGAVDPVGVALVLVDVIVPDAVVLLLAPEVAVWVWVAEDEVDDEIVPFI